MEATIDAIIGPERRDKLIRAFADRLILDEGMTDPSATSYAEASYAAGNPECLVAVGQVWRSLGKQGGPCDFGEEFIIDDVDRDSRMVSDDRGLSVTYFGGHFTDLFELVGWPAGEHPETTRDPVPSTAPAEDDEEETPNFLVAGLLTVSVRRSGRRPDQATVEQVRLPMLGDGYRTTRCADDTVLFVMADLNALFAAGLESWRDGWQGWLDENWTAKFRRRPMWQVFCDLTGYCELEEDDQNTELGVLAYANEWLYNRIVADVVALHGGARDDYDVTFMWGPHYLNRLTVWGLDPRQPLPVDHPLQQTPDQQHLF